ncbi:transporter family-2 protein [Lacrimispora xylanisolvens]|mgnify:CR=1 FL=1|jgi:transporter family-2 protein|uniref:Transporter family-2 protein n=1 Tax=Lacrimispora xylanisolvens TaxID=384636 RepID=A0A2S6HWY9_9FIRM|nr:DMT family transporter [Hungatella xylanolytica]MBE5987741.1 DMT family transporter [Paenibacillaceae bacterium]MTK07283.1 DMT family transporter [Hungatella sp.]PPK82487.1 transporter family-2 protein [Hungatella xylanolytica]
MTGFIIALISGALMSIQGVLNTGVSKQTSMWVSTGWVQLTAFLTCLILWYFSGRDDISTLLSVHPKYMLIGGIIGAFITYTVVKSMGTLGPAKAALVIVVSQIVVAYAVEVFGLFGVEKVGFEWKKLIGAVVAIIGIIIFN